MNEEIFSRKTFNKGSFLHDNKKINKHIYKKEIKQIKKLEKISYRPSVRVSGNRKTKINI